MYLQKSNVYNEDVKIIQHMLNYALSQPLYKGKWPQLIPDGYYGTLTEKAVKAFQYHHNPQIQQTGIVGDTTYAALKSIGPSIYTAPPYSMIDKIRTQTYIAREIIYTSFRTKYELFFTSIMETLLDESREATRKFLNNVTYNKMAKNQLFKDLAKVCTRVLRIDKIIGNPAITQLQNEIKEIEASTVSRKAHKISQKNVKIEKIINKIKNSTVVHPHELASKASKLITKTAGKAVKWASVILDVCELVNHLIKPHNNSESEEETKRLFGKIVDDIILVFIGVLTGIGLAALGASSWPIWVAILASIAIAFVVDSIYRIICEKAGGDQNKPLSLTVYEKVMDWIESPQCQKMMEPREMYIQAAPPKMIIKAASPRLIIQNPK